MYKMKQILYSSRSQTDL